MLVFLAQLVVLLTITIFVLVDAYNVLFVDECVKPKTRSLILFWSGIIAAFCWVIAIFSVQNEPTNPMPVLNTSNALLSATYMLLWPISNRRNLVSKDDALNKNSN